MSAGIILYIRSTNERRRYIVTSRLIGWVHTQNDPCVCILILCKWRVSNNVFNALTKWMTSLPSFDFRNKTKNQNQISGVDDNHNMYLQILWWVNWSFGQWVNCQPHPHPHPLAPPPPQGRIQDFKLVGAQRPLPDWKAKYDISFKNDIFQIRFLLQ